MTEKPILFASATEDRVPSVIWVREVIGQTESKARAGITDTTANVYEAYHCGSRGEVIRSNCIYLDGYEPRLELADIQGKFPRLYSEIVSRCERSAGDE